MNKKRLLMTLLVIITVSIGASLTLKAAIGVGAWDAVAQTGSEITGIKVGTVGMILNITCVFVQLFFLRKDFKINHALQIVLSVLLGYTVNFFYYTVFGQIEITHYYQRMLMLVAGLAISSLSVGVMMLLDVVTFALEGACKVVADRTGMEFHVVRQLVDVFSVIISLGLSFLFALPFAVREGTIIGMLTFAPMLGFFMKKLKPLFKKYDLTD